MKRRLLAGVLTFVMVLSLLPTVAWARNEEDASTDFTMQYDDYLSTSSYEGEIEITSGQDSLQVTDDDYLHAIGVGSATFTAGGKTYSVTVEPAKLNIVLVAGQSNANGGYGKRDVGPIAPDKGEAYWWGSSGLEDLSTHVAGITTVTTGWYPALAAEWYKLTGEKTVIIHRCVSGAAISNWASYEDGKLEQQAINTAAAVRNCIAEIGKDGNYKISHAGYYWLQGETDAQNKVSTADYVTAYSAIHSEYINALETANVGNVYGAILSVRPCTWRPWEENVSFEPTRAAQLYLANNTDNLYMASVITDSWHGEGSTTYTSDSGKYTVGPYENNVLVGGTNGHYNQSGYNILGLDAADTMYNALYKPEDVSDFDVIGYDGYTVYDANSTIKLEDNLQYNDSTKAQLVVMPKSISATCSSVTMVLTDAEKNPVDGVMDKYGLIDVAKVTEPLTLTVTANSVEKSYTVTVDGTDVPDDDTTFQNYYWDFTDKSKIKADNTMLAAVSGDGWAENDLTYVKAIDDSAVSLDGKITDAGYTDSGRTQYFKTSNDIVLKKDAPWQIEWKGSFNLNSQAILANNYDSVTDSTNWNSKKEYLYFEANGNILVLRNGGLQNNNAFRTIPEEIVTSSDTIWTLKNDGNGNLTIGYQNGSVSAETTVTDLKDTYTFNGILGRFTKTDTNMAACYSGTIEYLKVFDPGTIAKEIRVALKDGVTYQVGDSPAKDELTVTLVYMDDSEKEITDYTIAPESFTTAGKQELTVSVQGLQSSVEVDVAAVYEPQNYYWDFTDDSKLGADGSSFASVTGNGWAKNDLTYVSAMDDITSASAEDHISSDGFSAEKANGNYFKTENSIVLKKNALWRIEWKGSFLTGASVVVLANNSDDVTVEKKNYSEKNEYLYYDSSAGTLSLRSSGTSDGKNAYKIPQDVALDKETVWMLQSDGQGNLTISYQNGDKSGETTVSGYLSDSYIFDGVLGRFAKAQNYMAACYAGTISYLKIYDPSTIAKEVRVELKDGITYQEGDCPEKDDLTVTLVYMDGSEKEITDYTIDPESFTTAGKQKMTVSAQGLQASVEVDVAAVYEPQNYYWDFTDDSKLGTDGSSFASVTGNVWSQNGLTYVSAQDDSTRISVGDNLSSEGYSAEKAKAHYFELESDIVLKNNMPWRIEWKGSFTDASVVILASNRDDVTTGNYGDKEEYLYYDHTRGTLSMRSGGTSDGPNVLEVPENIAKESETVWVLQNDGQGNLTISYQNGDEHKETVISGKLDDVYTFDGVFGRFAKVSGNMAACYAGTMSYLKVWENAQERTLTYVDTVSDGASTADVVAGDDVVVKAAPSSKDGYTFLGWKASDKGALYQPGDTFEMQNENVTLTAQWYQASTLTTNIDEQEFIVGRPTEFTFTTTANDDAGKMVCGTFTFNTDDLEKLEYLETKDGNWYELKGAFGPDGGFPMTNATSTFRATFKNQGNYTLTVSMTLASGGDVLCSVTKEFTVAKAAGSVTAPTAVSNLVYTGNAQTLINAGVSTTGEIQYKLGENGTYSTKLPEATDAGTYTVYYKVVGDKNHEDVAEKSFTVTIDKSDGSVTAPTAKQLTYTGEVQALVNAGSSTTGEIQYKLGKDGTYSTKLPEATDAGIYTVYYKVIGDKNHNDVAEANIEVVIAKAAGSVTGPTAENLTYTGKAQELVIAGSSDTGTILYKLGDGEYSETVPTATNAGTYTVSYKVIGDANHNDVAETSITVTIAKANQAKPDTPALKDRSYTSITLNEIAGAEYSKDGGKTWQSSPEFKGLTSGTTYEFVIRYAETKNYNASPASDAAKFTTRRHSSPSTPVTPEPEPTPDNSTSFVDVPANAYFADAVEWAVDKGVTNGLTDTMFGPYESCTRAQIVTFLWRAAGSPEPKAMSSFTDVPASAYYAKAVAWAVENGITNGMTETTFAPDATCTRGQSVTFLYRALKGTASGSTNFTDVAPDAFYADAVNWAVANNVTNGTSATTFSPNADCTRAEIVTFLYRAYQGK